MHTAYSFQVSTPTWPTAYQVCGLETFPNPLRHGKWGPWPPPGHANGVFVSGNYAFVADWNGGLVVARVDLPGV